MGFNLWEGIGKDHELLRKVYSEDNYRVIDTGRATGKCLICFSGNGLFYPNTEETFKRMVVDGDRYEWSNMTKSPELHEYYQRIILIRDIYKQWYVTGISFRFNNVDSVADLLRDLVTVEGGRLSVYTVGYSAGGYAALLFGMLLGAKRIFNFSGQYDLNEEIYKNGELVAPFLKEYKDSAGRYYDLKPLLQNRLGFGTIYYFFPCLCDWDKRQHESVKNIKGIKSFLFNNKNHGDTVYGGVEIDILTSDDEKLLEVCASPQPFSKFSFARHYHSLAKCLILVLKNVRKKVRKLFKA